MYIIIVGCGRVGSQLARFLADAGDNVVVIDKDTSAFQKLGSDFNGLTITGDGFDVDLLKEAGIEQTDAFCTVTDNDNANIMSGQVAKRIFHIPKVIARINDVQYAHLYKELGIDIVNGTVLLSSLIRNKIIESRFSSFFLENTKLDTIEIEVSDKIAGKKIEEINLPGELIISAVVRRKKDVLIPRPKDKIEPEDLLIGIVKIESLAKVRKIFGLK